MLAVRGLRRTAPAEQIGTWNLSTVWRLPVEGGDVWLKTVPPFAAHEGRLLAALQGRQVPILLAQDDGRLLMADVLRVDLYQTSLPRLCEMVRVLVGLQCSWIARSAELLALGVSDWRSAALGRAIASVVERTAEALSAGDRETLAGFVQQLPDRLAAVAACRLPETLVHGDFHPGNVRGDESMLVVLDWSDSGFGHPMLDEASFLARIPPAEVPTVRTHWHRAWAVVMPGSDPVRASQLLAPIAAARRAAVYRAFLDRIEPSEQPYHQADPAAWLAKAAVLVRRERHDAAS